MMSLDRWYDTWLKYLRRKDIQAFQEINYANLTWKCEVCRRERPDNKISVFQRPVKYGHENIKYCNDSPQCEDMSSTYGLFELRRLAKENEDD